MCVSMQYQCGAGGREDLPLNQDDVHVSQLSSPFYLNLFSTRLYVFVQPSEPPNPSLPVKN